MSVFWPTEIRPHEPMSREAFSDFCDKMHEQMEQEPVPLEPAMYLTRRRIQELFEVTPWSDFLNLLQARQEQLAETVERELERAEEGLF